MIESARRKIGILKGRSTSGVSRLEAVVAIQQEISTSPADLPTLLTLVAIRAQELTGASGAMIDVRDQENLVCRAATGSASSLVGLRTRMDGSLSGLAFATGQMLRCEDARADQRVDRPLYDSLHFRSLLVVPIRSWRTRFGVLTIISAGQGTFGNEQQQILSLLTGILASRLDLAEQLQERQLLLTENAIAIATLRESESRFRNAFDHSGIGMALVAGDGRLLKVNAALCRTVGYTQQELLLRSHQSITHPDDLQLDAPFVQRMLAGEITTYELEKRYLHKQGSVVWGLLTISSIKGSGQQPLYFIAQIQDITVRKETEEALKRLATRDDLTGLYNRREMIRLLKEETSRSDRHRRPVSLIMLDVDKFKKVNDTYGHQAGDQALQQIAKTIEDSVRSFDRVARYGGEEFAVILPETAGAEASIVAERIRMRVASQMFSISQEGGSALQIPLTISSGVATLTDHHDAAMEQLIREADAGLYTAKNGGRNRCVAAASALVVMEAQPAPDLRP